MKRIFTLIELLVVIAIIAILLALTVGVLSGVNAREVQADQAISNVKTAMTQWSTKYARNCFLVKYTFDQIDGAENPKNKRKVSNGWEVDAMPLDPFANGETLIGRGIRKPQYNKLQKMISYDNFPNGEYLEDDKKVTDLFDADAADGYLIYSVGENGIDDGGITGPGPDGKLGTEDDLDDIAAYIKF